MEKIKPVVIAIDGPAATGKSTLGRMIAERLGYVHFSTGSLYRIVGLKVLDAGLQADNEEAAIAVASKLSWDDVIAADPERLSEQKVGGGCFGSKCHCRGAAGLT